MAVPRLHGIFEDLYAPVNTPDHMVYSSIVYGIVYRKVYSNVNSKYNVKSIVSIMQSQ